MEVVVIEKIGGHPALWKPSHPSHSKKLLKKLLYGEVAMQLAAAFPEIEGIVADTAINKFHMLKKFIYEGVNKNLKIKSGSLGDVSHKWKHSFFIDVVPLGESTSNLSTASGESQASDPQVLVIHTDPFLDDEEIIHKISASQREDHVDHTALGTPPSSQSVYGDFSSSESRNIISPIPSPLPEQSRQEQYEPLPGSLSTPKHKRKIMEKKVLCSF